MRKYLDILEKVYLEGEWKDNRTGVPTKSLTGAMFEHNMSSGFPLLTTKKMGMRNIAAELEFFIKGYSNKKWLQERNNHIWDQWCDPRIIEYSTDKDIQAKMKEENELGRIYGVQWRNWNVYVENGIGELHKQGIDQLAKIIHTLKTNPLDRRMICMAWNPAELDCMALPPCHYSFQILSDGKYIDLLWNQRSVDIPLGLPYNIASYALLLMLIANTVDMIPRKLIGFLADVHIYENQLDGVKEQLQREVYNLPSLYLNDNVDIFEWEYDQFTLNDYISHPVIRMPISI